MITIFRNLQSFNDGKTKSVSVAATSSGGKETIHFKIIDQDAGPVTVTFPAAGGKQTVTVNHTASGVGLVKVTADNSTATIEKRLDVDKQPGDAGTGS
jgi:ABC-type transporter MlaC component